MRYDYEIETLQKLIASGTSLQEHIDHMVDMYRQKVEIEFKYMKSMLTGATKEEYIESCNQAIAKYRLNQKYMD